MNKFNRGLMIALVVSVAVNLLLLGVGIGHRFGDHAPPMMHPNPMFGLMRFAETLPEGRRQALLSQLDTYRQTARPAYREMRELQNRLRREIVADPVDPQALRAALDAIQSHVQTQQEHSRDAFIQLLLTLSAEERAALDTRMRHPRHGPRRAFDDKPGRD
ncbi:MAG: periplasmic heavy metal sensor [Pseudomonadales bacterium]